MKKRTIMILILILLALLLFLPVPSKMKDGGSVTYMPIVPWYQVYRYNRYTVDAEGKEARLQGYKIAVFGMTVYENTYTVTES